jgi:hypothetical protein
MPVIALLAAVALAYDPRMRGAVAVPDGASYVAEAGGDLVVGGADETWRMAAGGTLLERWKFGSTSATYASGVLVMCGTTGVYWAPDRTDPVHVSDTPCAAAIPWDGGVVVAEDTVRRYDLLYGDLVDPSDTGIAATMLLAVGSSLYLGGSSIHRYGGEEIPVDGTLGALGTVDGELAWTLSNAGVLVTADGDVDVGPGATAFAEADVDGDGQEEVVVLRDGAVDVRRAAGITSFGFEAIGLAIGSGPCDDVLLLTGSALQTWRTVDCGADADGDHDGVTPADGDCDDANAGVHPGATERCNGVDDDCSGAADEDLPVGPLTLDAIAPVFEGQAARLHASAAGCRPGAITWEVDPALHLLSDGDDVLAIPRSPGTWSVRASVTGNGATTATAVGEISVLDRVPVLDAPARITTAVVGSIFSTEIALEAWEDGVDVRLDDGPDGVVLTRRYGQPAWVVGWVPEEEGEFRLVFSATDDEGNRAQAVTEVHVDPVAERDTPRGCASAPSGIGGVAWLLAAVGVILRGTTTRCPPRPPTRPTSHRDI